LYDAFFLSWDEPNADQNWARLVDLHPIARRVSGIAGIRSAHEYCATMRRTSHFFVIDADNEIENFEVFRYAIPEWDRDYVHLWYARNPVNGLAYGWGGLKLFPRTVFQLSTCLDMTTSFPLKIIEEIVSTTRFDTSPLATWRSAFRECVKLALQDAQEARERLSTWCGVAEGPFASEALRGAREGREYGLANRDDPEALARINDYDWLAYQNGA
jgi:hypothetical protein